MRYSRCRTAAFAALLSFTTLWGTASADPLTVTGGYIQILPAFATDFVIETSGPGLLGEREHVEMPPVFLSGQAGDVVNLSSSLLLNLTGFSVVTNGQTENFSGRVDFHFSAGNSTIPSIDDAFPGGANAFAPFTFTGTVFGFASDIARDSGAPPLFTYGLAGRGTARSLFNVQRSSTGVPLFDEPLVAFSAIYQFEADSAPVPEPTSALLVLGGLAAWRARRRRLS
jgi:hypothetical protein